MLWVCFSLSICHLARFTDLLTFNNFMDFTGSAFTVIYLLVKMIVYSNFNI